MILNNNKKQMKIWNQLEDAFPSLLALSSLLPRFVGGAAGDGGGIWWRGGWEGMDDGGFAVRDMSERSSREMGKTLWESLLWWRFGLSDIVSSRLRQEGLGAGRLCVERGREFVSWVMRSGERESLYREGENKWV